MAERRRRKPFWTTGIVLTLVSIACFCTYAHAQDKTDLARQIIEKAGVKGGLIVHIGCGDPAATALTAALYQGEGWLVHGLDTDKAKVEKARERLRSLGIYGKVSVDTFDGKHLPYADNLVNLVVAGSALEISREEIMRVLAPGGIALFFNPKSEIENQKLVKPRPKEIDDWTHYLYDASNNAVCHDTVVGPPRHFQWIGSPRWSRHHDHMASMSALVSSKGRIFYIMDEGPRASIELPPKWFLVARDAFNGVILWKRRIPSWNTHRWPLKSGPAQLPRRLVAAGDVVYVTLGLDAPLTALDAATGKTLRTYDGTKYTEELIWSDGDLFVLVNSVPSRWPRFRQKDAYVWANTSRANKEWAWDEQKRSVVAVRADTGGTLWKKDYIVAPLTLAADGGHVYFHDGEKVVCLDRKSGKELWHSEPVKRRTPMPVSFGPTLVVYKDVVLFSGGDRSMTALSARDGKTLWKAKHPRSGHMSPEDLLVAGGLVWAGAIANGADSGVFTGRDLHTGEVKTEFAPDVKTYWFHHRCYRSKATPNYILPSRTGIEFVDFRAKHWAIQHWVRGGCLYGVMPCNGLVYAPPHSCGCYLESKLNSFNALAPESPAAKVPKEIPDEGRLERGPAFDKIQDSKSQITNPGDWPTYRHDAARSGSTNVSVPAQLKLTWQTDLGGRLSSVVVAGGKLFVASVDDHTLHALDAASGKRLWSYTTGGRIDSPPTIYEGRVLFGSADGWVYCLRASDGELAWRFRAAPADRRLTAYEQVESVWPVHGSVLVQDGAVYCVAGRSMFLDGGLRLLRLDPRTGRKLSETILDDRDPETGDNLQIHIRSLIMPVALPDILSSDGRHVYMRSQRFDMKGKRQYVAPPDVSDQVGEGVHPFCQIGFLDGTWFHRSYWLYGNSVTVYGYGRKPEYVTNSSVLEYHLFGADKKVTTEAIARVRRASAAINQRSVRRNANSSDWKLRRAFPIEQLTAVNYKWRCNQPSVQVRAMVLANKTLFVCGPPDVIDERRAFRLPDDEEVNKLLAKQADALEGKLGGRLWAVSASDGKVLARYKLDVLPAWDGMAAAGGRLFLASADGKVMSFGPDKGQTLPSADDEPLQVVSTEPPEPDYVLPPPVPKDEDFARVSGGKMFQSKLGYRMRGESRDKAAIAVKKLDTPLRKRATFKLKFKAISTSGGYLVNGFLAFGDGPKDEQLVKCGVRVHAKAALIIQGPLKGGKAKSQKLQIERDKVYPMSVTVDLEKRTVKLSVRDVNLEARLQRPMEAITYVGYAVDRAMTDFSPVEISGE